MFTTLSPCTMCTGAMILYGIKRCVMGENDTFVGGESILKDHGVEIVNLNLDSCKELMSKFIKQSPEIWNEVSVISSTRMAFAESRLGVSSYFSGHRISASKTRAFVTAYFMCMLQRLDYTITQRHALALANLTFLRRSSADTTADLMAI